MSVSETPFLPYGKQWIDESDLDAVRKVLLGEFLTTGPAVDEFEVALCKAIGVPNSVAVNSGTAALHIAALAANLGAGDAAFVPALTFAATSNAVLYCGAKPYFVDVTPETFGMDPAKLEAAVHQARKDGLRPKIVFPVHYAGLPCDMPALSAIAEKEKLVVIEDACHALGATYGEDFRGGAKVGVTTGRNMTCLSFHPVKHVTTGEGGAVTTHCEELAVRLKALRSHGIVRAPHAFVNKRNAFDADSGSPNAWYHEMQELGWNYRMPDILAALGASQMKRLDSFVERRRSLASQYSERLSGLKNARLPAFDSKGARNSFHLYALRVNFETLKKTRNQVMSELRTRGVGTQVHYLPVYWHPFYQNNPSLWAGGACAVAESFYESELSIPMYPLMSDSDVERVATAIRDVIG